MAGNGVPKQRRESTAPPPHLAFNTKAHPVTRRVIDSTKKKEGVGLADLRDIDKAKVARLINHVMVAFKEIQRLKELLELERSTQEALVAKLQQQNREVATEVSQLRLKLASLQFMSPLPSQKVYLHTGKRPSLSPIREAESEGSRGLVPEGIEETVTILRERENHGSDFTTTAEVKEKGIFEKSEGTEQCVGNGQMGEFHTSNPQAYVSKSRGKENKDPELLPKLTGAPHLTGEGDAGVIPKRPPPRPLPDLLSNILHRCKDVECAPSADQSGTSVKFVSEGDSLIGSFPILQGLATSKVPQASPQAAQATWSCFSLGLDSAEEPSVDAAPASHVLHDLSICLLGDQGGCTFHVPCSQTATTHVAAMKQCQAKTHVDLDGHMIRSEAGGKDVLCCKHLEGGGPHEASNCVVFPHCKCTPCHQCLRNSMQGLPSNLTNVPCPEQLGGSEKERNETSNHEDRIEPNICTSQKKLRFDPTAGEEGSFYYVSDVEKNVKHNLERRSLQPTIPGERQGVQVGGKTERVSSSMSSMEGQRLNRDPLESHWTPEAIERRNSFHRIPVVSPRAMNDNERQPDEQTTVFSDSTSASITETEGRGVSGSEDQLQLPTSKSEVLSLRNEKPYSLKLRPSSQRTSKCINCCSVVPLGCRKASQSSKLFANHRRRCSKCSSIVEPTSSIQRYQENEKCRRRLRREKHSSKGKPSSTEFGSVNETCVRGTEEEFSVSDPSTPSRSGNLARCGKCTTLPKSRLFKPVQQKQRRGHVGTTNCVPADEEGSNPASVIYCVASEDMYLSTRSNTDYSSQTRRHVPSFPFKVCRIHTRKVKKKRGSRRELKSVKLHSGHCSESTQEVFDVNRAILDMLRQSDGKQKGQLLKGPVADSTECWIETWRFGKPHKSSCNESIDEETSKASSGSFALHEQLDADVDLRRGLKLACEGRRRARLHRHVRGRTQSLETWKSFDVDDLLDRFIQSNAEYAAELIKCSVYFESTSSRPSSQSNIVSEEEDRTLSNLPFRNSMAAKQGIGSHIVSSARGQPRREFFSVDHDEFTSAQPCPEESVRCSKCGGCVKPGTVLPPAGAIETVESTELRDLCDTCSVSLTPEKKVVRSSADMGPDISRQSASVPPPIVLPRLNWDDALKIHEARRQHKVVHHPSTTDILICDVKNSGDWTEDALHDHPNLSGEGHRMPIITGVSVSSRRSTPLLEMEEDCTAKELTEMFDMSLYDLVNDLEGQRRDYWRRVNRRNKEEGTIGKECNNRRQPVNVDKVHGMYSTGRLTPKKQVLPNHFR